MSSTIHEEDINDALAEAYAKEKELGHIERAVGITLAAEAIGELGCVSSKIVKDLAERDYFCEHPDQEIIYKESNFYCGKCDGQLAEEYILDRLKNEGESN